MSKEKLLNNIEEGLLNYYLDKDYTVSHASISNTIEVYEGQNKKYENLIKVILFKSKTHIQKNRIARVISIAEATGRLKEIEFKNKTNVFSIFKNHIEKHGLAANYRNFDKMTENEMGNILSQLDLTSLFDEIDASLEGDE